MRVAHEGLAPEPLPGTIIGSADADAADFGINPLVPASTAMRPPRVVEGKEVLPSAPRRDARAGPPENGPIATDGGRRLAGVQNHPAEQIDDNFIARAVSTTPAETKAATGPAPNATLAEQQSGFLSLTSWW